MAGDGTLASRQSDCGRRDGEASRRSDCGLPRQRATCGGDWGRMGLAAETAQEVGGGFAEFWESEEICEG